MKFLNAFMGASGAYVSKVRVSDGKTKTFKSLVNSNLNNDPLNPTPPWTNIAPNYDNAHTYALNDYVVVRVGNDDYRYKSLQNSNTGHQPESSPTYWDLDQPALWQAGTTYSLNAYTQYNGRYRDWETDRKSTRLNSSHSAKSRMPSSA